MAKTKISDIIVPEVFNPYVIQRTMQLSALYNSGIISNNPELDRLASSGGSTINMPYWEDLGGDDEVLSDDGALIPGKITAGRDGAALLMRGRAWSTNDLAKALSGSDPMAAIGDLVAEYWARRMQATTIKLLDGAFAASNMTNKVSDISAAAGDAAKIDGETFLDALQKMGDAKDKLTGVIMHSATETQLRKNNLIQTELDSNNKPISLFMEKRVIIDDSCPIANGVYTTYLFGQGAIGLGNGAAPVPTETDRDSLAGDDILINRKHYILHPRGVKWIGTAAGSSPTNVELATGTNWSKVYEDKAIRMVKFIHKL
ncbi:hypothetical protein C8E03_11922 [Lachnotalea glycerini]|uniref:Coat protein n=1 Tax=Lachnotalea glycerini TaxID=1763509 RepID=A0A318EJ52_9FIRM|nr:major capsid protein [Lachnotalea glycerini]PXV85098.1 hypothetical protein C8E03_11922 [Lachnotalea glycerini]